MAYASMVTAPVLILFVGFQGWFINSIASFGVKADSCSSSPRRGCGLDRDDG